MYGPCHSGLTSSSGLLRMGLLLRLSPGPPTWIFDVRFDPTLPAHQLLSRRQRSKNKLSHKIVLPIRFKELYTKHTKKP
jgi:hypothetical protein